MMNSSNYLLGGASRVAPQTVDRLKQLVGLEIDKKRVANEAAATGPETSSKRVELIGAIDQGTSSTRFLVFENGTGKLVASSQLEIKRITPREGWVEIDPMAIMSSVYATIGNVHEQLIARNHHHHQQQPRSGVNGGQLLKCIGICNQRESAVVWDARTGQPLYNVIVWMDNRTKDLVDDMIDSIPGRDFNRLKDKTGLPMSTYFSAFKLKWLLANVAEVRQALREQRLLFGTVDSWILWNLTGNHLTDVTNASRTFLMDIETLDWDKSLCKTFGVPMQILPKILASADDFGSLRDGPFEGTPITGVIGDQSAALFGHNCLLMGQTKATFGTGCFIMQNIGPGPLNGALSGVQREAKRGLITTVGYKLRDRPVCYALEGSIKIAGAGLTWLRDNIQLIENYEECDQLINKTAHSAGVFFVPALGGLYSPYWDPNAAGLFIGLSQFTRREHMVRATFDSIAFQTNDILSLMRGVTSGLMIDGGLCKSENLCQILADITGCDIVRPSMCETSALGAAMVAGCGAGIWTYEQMMANSSKALDQTSANQCHHYPTASLYCDDKLTHLTQRKICASSKGYQNHQQQQQQQVRQRRARSRALDDGDQLDAGGGGGGLASDSGGGRLTAATKASSSLDINSDYEEEEGEDLTVSSSHAPVSSDTDYDAGIATSSGEFTTTSCCVDDVPSRHQQPTQTDHQSSVGSSTVIPSQLPLVASCLAAPNQNHLQKPGSPFSQMAPSSGYSSGDNFEATTALYSSCQLTASTGGGDTNGLLRNESPSSMGQSSQMHEVDGRQSPASSAGDLNLHNNHHHNQLHTQHQQHQSNVDTQQSNLLPFSMNNYMMSRAANGDNSSGESHSAGRPASNATETNVNPTLRAAAEDEDEEDDDVIAFGARDSFGEDGYESSQASLISDEEDNESQPLSLVNGGEQTKNFASRMPASQQQSAHNYPHNHHHHHLHNGSHHSRPQASKPVDVFQSYISLEHRTELVDTWRRAVERSMQWTKIHHEEVRRIDYQRLSSLPISMYLFFSIGMVALSGALSSSSSGGMPRLF